MNKFTIGQSVRVKRDNGTASVGLIAAAEVETDLIRYDIGKNESVYLFLHLELRLSNSF